MAWLIRYNIHFFQYDSFRVRCSSERIRFPSGTKMSLLVVLIMPSLITSVKSLLTSRSNSTRFSLKNRSAMDKQWTSARADISTSLYQTMYRNFKAKKCPQERLNVRICKVTLLNSSTIKWQLNTRRKFSKAFSHIPMMATASWKRPSRDRRRISSVLVTWQFQGDTSLQLAL